METWRNVPLYYAIVEELERRGGTALDVEIYRSIRERFEVTFAEFLKALMILEMQDVVRVEVLREDLRNVQLVKRP